MAEESVAVFLGPVGQGQDEALDLLTGGVSQGFGSAEFDGIGLDEFGIELMLADDLAEAITDLRAGAVPIPVCVSISTRALGRKFFGGRGERSGKADQRLSYSRPRSGMLVHVPKHP